ncbi:MAG: hypothetical protein AB7O86_14485, partial [Porticoccaceae bacterium]
MTDDSRKLVGEDKLREWLEAHGFRCSYFLGHSGNDCNWHAYRRSAIDARQCERNSDRPGMQIVVRPTSILANGQQYRSAEIDLYGEAGAVCWRMSAYSIHPDKVPELLPDIEAAL